MNGKFDTTLVKRPHQSEKYTTDQIEEISKCIQDPVYFIGEYCSIQHPVKGRVKFNLFDYQKRLIETYNDYRYAIALLPRQTGKSTAAAAYLLWYAMYKPDSVILIAAHKYAGAQEIMQRLRFIYETLPNFIRSGCTSYNRGSIEFENGSRIVSQATTETTGRGMSLTLIYLDEFAYVQPRMAEEFWTALSPTLSTGGKCIITSTPNQDDDQFARIWKDASNTIDEFGNDSIIGKNGFKSFTSHWNEHPDRDQAWADEERAKIGEEKFRREHLCEFITADETLINPLKLTILETKEPIRKQGQIRWYKPIEKNKIYLMGLDPSLGTGGDNSAIEVYEMPSLTQVAEWQHNKTAVEGQIRTLHAIVEELYAVTQNEESIFWSVENNSLGEAALVVIREMGEERFHGTFLHEPKRKGHSRMYRQGFTTTQKSKLQACAKYKHYVENDKLIINSSNLLRETKNFIAKGPSFSAKPGETDDLVSATLLVIRMTQIMISFDEGAFDALRETLDVEEILTPMPIGII